MKKANEIMNIMNQIEYGFKDDNGFNLINDCSKWNDFNKFYYLLSPKELLDKKCGVCWDQVELERKLFEDNNIKVETYFIFIDNKNTLPSHTFLTYEYENKYYWFEHSWYDMIGIHEYTKKEIMLNDIKNKFIESRKDETNYSDKLYLYKYKKPKYHLTCNEFYKYIETCELIN